MPFPRGLPANRAAVLVAGVLLAVMLARRHARRSAATADAAIAPGTLSFQLEGTRIRVPKGKGNGKEPGDAGFYPDDDLLGAELVYGRGNDAKSVFRIDAMAADPDDPSGKLMLYALSTRDSESSPWRNACTQDSQGLARGFLLEGRWSETGEHLKQKGEFEITCTSGAEGKCVRMGYRPWESPAMWDLHQACTRLVRADYCGDGHSYTRDGTPIDVYDVSGIQTETKDSALTFEAAWGKDGATCVRRPRVPKLESLDALRTACPQRLGADKLGEPCDPQKARANPLTLIFNKS